MRFVYRRVSQLNFCWLYILSSDRASDPFCTLRASPTRAASHWKVVFFCQRASKSSNIRISNAKCSQFLGLRLSCCSCHWFIEARWGKPCKKTLWSCQPRRDTMSFRTNLWLREMSSFASCLMLPENYCMKYIYIHACEKAHSNWRCFLSKSLVKVWKPIKKALLYHVDCHFLNCHIISIPKGEGTPYTIVHFKSSRVEPI